MPSPVFSWFPDAGSSCATKPAVQSTKFGDGYELRVVQGINSIAEKWSVKFTRAEQEAKDIIAFFKARNGAESFTWTTPNGDTGTFVCKEWRHNRLKGGGAMEVTGDFEQVFDY